MLDRDIRLNERELYAAEVALRDEVRKRDRSIARAEASRAAGGRVQHGVLQEHHEVRAAAASALVVIRVAREQIGHRLAEAARA